MDNQPKEILEHILRCVPEQNLVCLSRVSKQWRDIIENKILHLDVIPTFDECITSHNYFYGKLYLDNKLDAYQKQLIKLVGDKILMRRFGTGKMKINKGELLIEYSRIGSLKVVMYLIEKGADYTFRNYMAFQESSKNGHLELVKLLLTKGCDNNYCLLQGLCCCIQNKHIPIVKLFIEKNMPIDYNCLNQGIQSGSYELVKLLVDNDTNLNYNLHIANDALFCQSVCYGNLEVVKLLLEKGANIHAKGDVALISSAQYGHINIVAFLLENGLNVNAQNGYALIKSVLYGHIEIVKLLLEKGADIHAQNDDALLMAIINNKIKIVKFLLRNGANRNVLSTSDRKKYIKYCQE